MEWKDDTYIEGKYKGFAGGTFPLALFDLDGTIIKTKSGDKFYQNVDDWKFFSPNVKSTLYKISRKFHIVIITNQLGIEKGKTDVTEWKKRVDTVAKFLNVPLCVLCSKGNDIYRKPHPTFYRMLTKGKQIYDKSFFCGDAMGRKTDHSDTDLKFALNCGLKAYTPELIFDGNKTGEKLIVYPNILNSYTPFDFVPKQKDFIIMVGFPASGKSYTSKLIVKKSPYEYVIINRDMLGTIPKCLKRTQQMCGKGVSIIIDNTNPSIESRKLFIDIAKKYGYNIRCIVIDCAKDKAKHNNYHRRYMSDTDLIPDVVYNVYSKKFENPTKDEGFDEIDVIKPPSPMDMDYGLYYF